MARRRHLRVRAPSARQIRRAQETRASLLPTLPRLSYFDRKSLLLGTALASTLLIGALAAPTPASALTCDGDVGTGPTPIDHLGVNDPIICLNTEPRLNTTGPAIGLTTINAHHQIFLNNTGELTSTNPGGDAFGIYTGTLGANSPIRIVNNAIVRSIGGDAALGIFAVTGNANSPINVVNEADFIVHATDYAFGAYVHSGGKNSPIYVQNYANLLVTGEACLRPRAVDVWRQQSPQYRNSGNLTISVRDLGATAPVFVPTGIATTALSGS